MTMEAIKDKQKVLAEKKEVLKNVQKEIGNLKFQIKQADDEICYYEDQNRKNQAAQNQLQKANEYETCRAKEFVAL